MKPTFIFVASHPLSVSAFLLPHIDLLRRKFYIVVCTNTDQAYSPSSLPDDLHLISVPLHRTISIFSDLRAFIWLYLSFRKLTPFCVHTITPKSGLLGMAAAWFAGVPVRVHSFTGQVWATRSGISRQALKFADSLIAFFSTHQLADSPSQLDFLLSQRVLSARTSRCLAEGSISGVNLTRFSPNPSTKLTVRSELGTPHSSFVCLFLGRLTPDKGIFDLAIAFSRVALLHPESELWIVGPDEGDYFQDMAHILAHSLRQVKRVGFTSQPERYLQAADLLCLPSYREGFGSTVIEAASCGVPALVSRIYGLTDAVQPNRTGWMFTPGNIDDLSEQLRNLIADPQLVSSTGLNALRYVSNHFSEEIVAASMFHFYKQRLNEANL
jgi:glycosyltransferase involved in cell wall biosynthesis